MNALAAVTQPVAERVALFDAIWSLSGLEAPQGRTIAPDSIPAEPRMLLMHEGLMTTMLEAHYRTPIELCVVSSGMQGNLYVRRIALTGENTGIPLLLAGARIDLGSVTEPLRAQIIEQKVPLGRIFRDAGVPFVSRPVRFLEVYPSPDVRALFWMRASVTLFGRQTAALCNDRKIGDIIEILPPFPRRHPGTIGRSHVRHRPAGSSL